MNQILSTAFNGLFLYLGLALAFAVLAAVLRSPRFKGWRGERAVQAAIRRQLDPLVYVDMHNVTLPTADGGRTQIDHLIFSPYGLFVLETKNLQGWIFGSERQAEWTQKIHKNHSQKFQNPLRQNYKHIKTLQSLLDIAPEHLHSVIAFVGDCEFKTEMPAHVTRGLGFVGHIQSFTQPVWSPEQMQALLDKPLSAILSEHDKALESAAAWDAFGAQWLLAQRAMRRVALDLAAAQGLDEAAVVARAMGYANAVLNSEEEDLGGSIAPQQLAHIARHKAHLRRQFRPG